ncbi:hypothetical protein GUJ93_ZPchr0015g6895 [Zizania palustris]|uniref:Uncharacterized protein n=1 Tax=Zizania palustris TaxID=103762 RepID=A0A8J5TD69_ZIZPA|nr:hypothetical protein GUJ93_ZPchr0015g6895 [Zizania palustris]
MRIAATASPTAAGGARPGTAARGQAVAAVATRPPVVMATATATDLLDWIVNFGWNSASMPNHIWQKLNTYLQARENGCWNLS